MRNYLARFPYGKVEKIIHDIYTVAESTEALIYSVFKELSTPYVTSFGILIAAREPTVELFKKYHDLTEKFAVHHADSPGTWVNISFWFDYEKIFEQKIELFLNCNAQTKSGARNNIYLEALHNIFSDVTASRWSLRKLLLNMFNNNIRRFFESILSAFDGYSEDIKEYNRLWNYTKNAERFTDEINDARHLCRKMVLRVVLNHMQNNKHDNAFRLFNSMGARNDNAKEDRALARTTYARRILTYLDNVKLKQIDNDRDAPFQEDWKANSFLGILIMLLRSGNFEKNDSWFSEVMKQEQKKDEYHALIEDIASVMEYSSIINITVNRGVPFIRFTVDSEEMNGSNLKIRLQGLWDSYVIYTGKKDDNNRDMLKRLNLNKVRITTAGSAFALYCPEFEYFACRYAPSYPPLPCIRKEADRYGLIFGMSGYLHSVAIYPYFTL